MWKATARRSRSSTDGCRTSRRRSAKTDLAILTADHGCDPTAPGTDHTREFVPLLACGRQGQAGYELGLRGSLSDIGQTVAENFERARSKTASAFYRQLL